MALRAVLTKSVLWVWVAALSSTATYSTAEARDPLGSNISMPVNKVAYCNLLTNDSKLAHSLFPEKSRQSCPRPTTTQLPSMNPKADATEQPVTSAEKPYGSFYWRQDQAEMSQSLFPSQLAGLDSKGASFSFTRNYLGGSNEFSVQSFMSWVPPGWYQEPDINIGPNSPPELGATAIGPYVYLNGKFTDPFKKTERSAAQFGINGEAEVLNVGKGILTLSALPYYQTDLRGYGQIEGANFAIEPTFADIALGAEQLSDPVSYYWRAIGEFNPVHVETAGLSDFRNRTDYLFYGVLGELRATLSSAQRNTLCGRLSALASDEPYWDSETGRSYNNLHAEVDFALNPKQETLDRYCGVGDKLADPKATPSSKMPQIDASIALTYDDGTNRDTFSKDRKLELKLTIGY